MREAWQAVLTLSAAARPARGAEGSNGCKPFVPEAGEGDLPLKFRRQRTTSAFSTNFATKIQNLFVSSKNICNFAA